MRSIVDHVEFKRQLLKLRLIHFGDKWGGPYWVASVQLQAMIWNDDNGYPSDEAQAVDELIFFFIPTHWFKLSDGHLRDMIFPYL